MDRGHARIVPLLGVLMLLGGCISTFSPVDADFKAKGKTIAVVAGLDNEPNIATARNMAESLKRNTRFQVVPASQVKQSLPGYPSNIQGPYKSSYFEIEVDYTKTDMKKIRSIQQQLGVDYLYVIWTPSATVYNEKIHSLNAVAQLFEKGREVGNGRFNATAGRTDCCLVAAPDSKDKANAIKDATDYVAREIGEKTGMAKQQ
ncbi:MAG: hypothetical protein ACYC7L_03670 [Nitrospirota bacterium]